MSQDVRQKFSSDICSKCGGEAPDWKCPKCGKTSKSFDPSHWKDCPERGKMQAQCKKCEKAEENCQCQPL